MTNMMIDEVELQSPTLFPGPYLRSPPARQLRSQNEPVTSEMNSTIATVTQNVYWHLFPPPPSLKR